MKIRVEVLLVLVLAVSSTGYALDTTEAFDPGFSVLEVYFGYHGIDNSSESILFPFRNIPEYSENCYCN